MQDANLIFDLLAWVFIQKGIRDAYLKKCNF